MSQSANNFNKIKQGNDNYSQLFQTQKNFSKNRIEKQSIQLESILDRVKLPESDQNTYYNYVTNSYINYKLKNHKEYPNMLYYAIQDQINHRKKDQAVNKNNNLKRKLNSKIDNTDFKVNKKGLA